MTYILLEDSVMNAMLNVMVMPMMIGTSELLLIGALVLLLFGGKKLPEMMRGLGQGVRSFKDGMKEGADPQGDAANHNDAQEQAAPQQQTVSTEKKNEQTDDR